MLQVIAPDMVPHPWQCEELLRIGGFLDPYDLSKKIEPSAEHPMLYCLPAANGSGKDQFLIAAAMVWFALVGLKNRAICTSSSYEQIKGQTEPGIIELVNRCNRLLGKVFRSIEFHHVCLATGSEIKLFATDDPKYAEGYHPWSGGRMMIVMNEAKSIDEGIFQALTRCTGYSYWLEISSPGPKSGRFYRDAMRGIQYPAVCELNKFYTRHISAYDCPHIPKSHIDRQIEEMPSWWVDSSIRALFSDVDDATIIPGHLLNELGLVAPAGDDIGIGLDTAAGIDENSLYVRRGNRIIHEYHFRQKDTTLTAEILDNELAPWRSVPYTFNSDDGGVSHAITDNLVKLGWRINRCHNQSPATNKRRFLNLGAEMWWKTRLLVTRREISHKFYDARLNTGDRRLFEQLTSRRCDGKESAQGRIKLEPKPEHKKRMGESPDRGDAFVLCWYSYRSKYLDEIRKPEVKGPARYRPAAEFIEYYRRHVGWDNIEEQLKPRSNNGNQRYSQQAFRI